MDSVGALWHLDVMHSPPADIEKLIRVRQLADEIIGLCEQLGHPLAANYVHMGLTLLEERVEPMHVRDIPMDLPFFE